MRRIIICAVAALTLNAGTVLASGGGKHPPDIKWSFEGIFGKFDAASRKRGFQVYSGVCAGCHALSMVTYRNLMDIGFTEDEVKAISAEFEVTDGPNDAGEMYTRPALPSDRFVSPFANEKAARSANGGAYPPDLSLIIKARPNGADYLHALLTGYHEAPPEGVTLNEGMNYNDYFPGNQIAMPQPLSEGQVEYKDGVEATLDQEARDVVQFLTWAASPELETRKNMGVKVMLFLIVLTAMLYVIKRRVWSDLH